jgi:glycosyltransferase involved in cell wall biosynthesis
MNSNKYNHLKMKYSIIFISNAIGGIKTFQNTLIKFLLRNDTECVLFDKHNFKINKNNRLKHYKINVLGQIYYTCKMLRKINIINKNKNSIFIFSNPVIFVMYFFYIKLFFKKNKIFFFTHSHLTKKRITLKLFNYISSIFFLFIDRVFYVSRFTKNWWEKKYFFCKYSKNSIQYNSIETFKKIKKIKSKKFRIGFVGRLGYEKGLQKFLNIASKNKDKYIFNIFSNEKLKLNNSQKKYINFHLKKNLEEIYNKIDLLLVSSPIENCPFSVLEAKSFGIPTLVYLTKGGIMEIITNNHDGIIIKKYVNNLRLSEYIEKIKNNYNFFSLNALSSSKNFDAKIQITKLIRNKLLNN